jgi:hypothetical protein
VIWTFFPQIARTGVKFGRKKKKTHSKSHIGDSLEVPTRIERATAMLIAARQKPIIMCCFKTILIVCITHGREQHLAIFNGHFMS